MASTYLTRTPSSTGTQTKFTFSFWVKITSASNGADKAIFSSGSNSSNYYMIRFTSGDQLQILSKDNGNNQINYNTNRVFRDTNAWFHIVLAHDTTQSSGSRIKYYVNGEQVSSFQSSVEPSASANILYVNDTTVHAWGRRNYNSDLYTDMVLSHVHFCDGYAYQASDFGSTDSTTGEWKINTSPSVSYGTNGYFILKDGNSVTDQSPNTNNWTVGGGTLTKTEDCPSNVFATLNPLDKGYVSSAINLANGNTTTMNTSGHGDYGVRSTLGVDSGKFYWEVKIGSNSSQNAFGILPTDVRLIFDMFGSTPEANLYGVQRQTSSATNLYNNTTFITGNTAWNGAITSSDVVGFALDMDNGKLYLSKNGAFKDLSGYTSNLSSGTYPTFTIADTSKTYSFYVEMRTNDNNGLHVNFGQGFFGTTAISSEGTNASGVGKFEYDVPTGFTALSTKGLNI